MAVESHLQRWPYTLIYKGSHGGQFMEVAVQGDLENDHEDQFREVAKEVDSGKCQCRPI